MRVRIALLLMVVSVLGAPRAFAQTGATLTGVVEDASGGVLPAARISVRQVSTGVSRQAVAGADGRFTIAGLPAGEYEVRSELAGFRPDREGAR